MDDVLTNIVEATLTTVNPQANQIIKSDKLTPYIATISPQATAIDCKRLLQAKVVGLMLYGGSYYTSLHTVNRYYRNDNLKEQVSQADKAGMPYALYVDVRARSVAEAKLECNQLYYVISKYPPKLGLWLRLQTGRSIGVNNQILEEYYKHIERWGLKNKCGLYISRNDLKTFTWDDFYERYLLWLVAPVNSMQGVTDSLLTPEFFMTSEVV